MDGERCGADDDLLWVGHYPSERVSGIDVCHKCCRKCDDGQFVDHDCHHRCGSDGHWQGSGI